MLEYLAVLGPDRIKLLGQQARRMLRTVPGLAPSAMVAALYLAGQKDQIAADAFAVRVQTAVGLEAKAPELALRNLLARNVKRRDNDWHLCVYLKAWNLRCAGRGITTLVFREDESVPVVDHPASGTVD